MNATPRTIQFKLPWRGRQIGQRDSLLDPGVMQELVRTSRAVFVDEVVSGAGLVPAQTGSVAGAGLVPALSPKRKRRKEGETEKSSE